MPLDLTDDKSTLVRVMAWCHQATSYYLSQCWPRFMSPYSVTRPQWVNSLSTGWFDYNLDCILFKFMLLIDTLSNSHEIALSRMPLRSTDIMSTLVQVMAWCHHAYCCQCWLKSMLPYGITRPQWVNHFSLKTRRGLSCIFNTMAADDLEIQQARASAAIILT